jgi:hypothetical protein
MIHTSSYENEKAINAGIEALWIGTLPFCMDLYGNGNYVDHTNVFDFMQTKASP